MKKLSVLLLVVLVVSLSLAALAFWGPKLLPLLMNKPIQPQIDNVLPVTQETQMSTQETQQIDPVLFREQEENKKRLTQGCLTGQDCIQSIQQPKFVSAKQAAKFLNDDDLVIGLDFDGWETEDDPVKAYPIKILNWHEVVNDFLNESPVVITYCPLCNSAAVYNRMFDGKVSEFGVSGSLLNNNLVLHDKLTETLWTQLQGYSLVGKSYPQKLVQVPSVVMSWKNWKTSHPQTVVLSTDTGFEHDYNVSPYADYAESPRIEFPVEHSDSRLANKDQVYGVQMYDQFKAYPVAVLQQSFPEGGTFEDEVGGHPVKITYGGGKFLVEDAVLKKSVPVANTYWFCWVAMYERTELYGAI
ncbi:DUF3179 domain-containing protein [Candidatus Peregrinibacteria bacterium]|nr:DUF3179 domain-containing protein [Candidatus Peregrinibacteria bacterium]